MLRVQCRYSTAWGNNDLHMIVVMFASLVLQQTEQRPQSSSEACNQIIVAASRHGKHAHLLEVAVSIQDAVGRILGFKDSNTFAAFIELHLFHPLRDNPVLVLVTVSARGKAIIIDVENTSIVLKERAARGNVGVASGDGRGEQVTHERGAQLAAVLLEAAIPARTDSCRAKEVEGVLEYCRLRLHPSSKETWCRKSHSNGSQRLTR